MQALIDYFEHIPSLWRAIILAGGICFFWILEGLIPIVSFKYNKVSHAAINIFFTLTTIIVNVALAFVLAKASSMVAMQQFGLWYWLHCNVNVFTVIAALLLLDLIGAYTIHYVEHNIKFMWQFHVIHHTDVYVDTTTANRHHPGESVFRALFTALAILVTGAPIGIVMLYQSLSALLSQFNHANIILPKWANNILGCIIITPNIHRIHHHYKQPLTDSNYGNIFSIWDRVFGTLKKVQHQSELKFGLDTYPLPEEHSNVKKLVTLPFYKHRKTTNSNA
jgi:sterol desaturase/sphingolipid hydroxylase (fatty acid hydroxylase superfamily)